MIGRFVTVIYDRKKEVAKTGRGKVEIRIYLGPVCGKDKNLVHDNVLVYNFIEVLLAPSDKGGKDRHQ